MRTQLTSPGLMRRDALIDGQWVGADSGKKTTILDPSTGDAVDAVPVMGQEEARRAIDAGSRALAGWSARTAKDRAGILRRWYELILQHQRDLAAILTSEQGKPLAEAQGEVVYAASYVEWFAEEARRVYGDVMSANQPDKRIVVLRQPIGVCVAITPWNFPAAMVTRKIAPALAAGCTAVLKPAPQTPFTALALAELALQAGVPAGVFNVVTGDAELIGREFTSNPTVRKLSFTGSTAVGRLLMQQSSGTIKKLSLELGGNAPFIVFDDADLDAAVSACIATKFRNGGQTCVSANRIYVQATIYDAFAERLAAAVGRLRVGDGFTDVDIGPLVNRAALDKVRSHVDDALLKGARGLCGGAVHALGGNFFQPTVLAGCDASMRLAREETFGPLAPLFSFQSEEEVIAMANDTEYGLAAYFFSRDVHRAWRVAESLEFGIVGMNTAVISAEQAPFGGMKQSGLGREGSRYGMDDYLELKYVCMGIAAR